jgi:hypothetical protein
MSLTIAKVFACCLSAIGLSALGTDGLPAAAVGAEAGRNGDQPKMVLKTEQFDRDPGWEGHSNRIVPKVIKPVQQDFDYSATNFAGKAKREIGGTIWRSPARASYAARIPARTLNDRLSASGTFALTASSGSSGAFFGWFNSKQPGNGRQSNMGFHFAGEGAGSRLTLRLVTGMNQSCGTKVTPWIVDKEKPRGQRKFRPPSIRNDGTRYTWKLDYDPQANDGNGQMQFTIRSNRSQPQEFEGKTFIVALPQGFKEQGTTFDRFGLMNTMKPGNSLTLYFDDLQYDGTVEDFSQDPGWIGSNNHAGYPNREWGGSHNFGFSADTSCAGGAPGEVGGMIWRSGAYGYYADRVGPLSLADRLEARGKIVLNVGPPDSGMYLGWFNGTEKENAPTQAGSFVGVKIGGPTRVGHYVLPAYATAQTAPIERIGVRKHPANVSVDCGEGPVITPQEVFQWKLVYDPASNGGKGAIEATLGDESVTLPLKDGDKAKGASFDRFGLFTAHRGGSFVRIYFDDLKYTAARSGRRIGSVGLQPAPPPTWRDAGRGRK